MKGREGKERGLRTGRKGKIRWDKMGSNGMDGDGDGMRMG
jgi:hypothetical protein